LVANKRNRYESAWLRSGGLKNKQRARCLSISKRRLQRLLNRAGKGVEESVSLSGGVALASFAYVKEGQGRREKACRHLSLAARSYEHSSLAGVAIGRGPKNPLCSGASLSRRRSLGKRWGADVYSPQVIHFLKHAPRKASLESTRPINKRRPGASKISNALPQRIPTKQRGRLPRSRSTLRRTSLTRYSSTEATQTGERGRRGSTSALGNLSRGRLPNTGGPKVLLLLVGVALIGGGWLLVRRSSSAR
jgi:LPXTG-motif cell wall-anchored protein